MSKAIHRLESDLGIQLFQRSTRQIRLTEAGRRYANTARFVLDELTACEDSLKSHNDALSGLLKINVPVSYGRLYIRHLVYLLSFLIYLSQVQYHRIYEKLTSQLGERE